MPHYFAYGSNMGNLQMQTRCPDSQRLGKATLFGFRWNIAADGYATIHPAPDDYVEGVLFEISATDELALDHFEEIHLGAYFKCTLPVMPHPSPQSESAACNLTPSASGSLPGDTCCEALVYRNTDSGSGNVSPEYGKRLIIAVNDAVLESSYIERYLQPFLPELRR